MKFALQDGRSRESLAVISYCIKKDHSFRKFNNPKEIPADFIPVGSVEYVEKSINKHIAPDYYPEFLSKYLNRKIWKSDKWITEKGLFIKPADKFKRFESFITLGGNKKRKKPPFYISEVVKFENEFRLYIGNGERLSSGFYFIDDKPPEVDIEWPKDFCGAVDLGFVEGKITLVEVNAPFACGWYGPNDEHEKYAEWLRLGFKYIKKL